jgi:hypothetical protein
LVYLGMNTGESRERHKQDTDIQRPRQELIIVAPCSSDFFPKKKQSVAATYLRQLAEHFVTEFAIERQRLKTCRFQIDKRVKVRSGVLFDCRHQLQSIAAASVFFIDPKGIDVHRSPPKVSLHSTNNSAFIAQKTGHRSRPLIASLLSIESANTLEYDAKVISARILVKLDLWLTHF